MNKFINLLSKSLCIFNSGPGFTSNILPPCSIWYREIMTHIIYTKIITRRSNT